VLANINEVPSVFPAALLWQFRMVAVAFRRFSRTTVGCRSARAGAGQSVGAYIRARLIKDLAIGGRELALLPIAAFSGH
jgi:hypothetical protein